MGSKQHFECIECNGVKDFQQKELKIKNAPKRPKSGL